MISNPACWFSLPGAGGHAGTVAVNLEAWQASDTDVVPMSHCHRCRQGAVGDALQLRARDTLTMRLRRRLQLAIVAAFSLKRRRRARVA